MFDVSPRRLGALVAVAAGALALSACSAGSLGSSGGGGEGGKVTLSFLADNSEGSQAQAKGLAQAFTAKNPTITINVESRPGGTDGDNLIKTRLSTGDMTDVFMYNTGSLFQALAPEKNLVPLDDGSWVGDLDPSFKSTVTANNKVYGAPFGNFSSGAILYNRPVYQQLGLQVPKTWADFMANSAKIKAAGKAPVIQTYQDTWSSQLFVLGDYHNVQAAVPDFADKYTKGEAKYATTPAALEGFKHLQEVYDAGYENKNFASTKVEDGVRMLAKGDGVQYPILSGVIGALAATDPQALQNIGLFAIPGSDTSKNGLTVWTPAGFYIPKSTTGAKLDAAKKFAAFLGSKEGCDAQTKAYPPAGPYGVKGCTLPDNVPQAVKDMQPYFESGATTPALEFLSPIKGPALEQITVEVGSGIRKADAGAALYDQDVKKQAQQLGLPGW
jgi:raffinose/stachyose/melibiose transport system substrate-binding protein